MEVHTPLGYKQGDPLLISLHGSGNFYVPGRRVSVLDVMMWKMYGTPSPYIIEPPKRWSGQREWQIMKPASQLMKENHGIKILWTIGDIETVQETREFPHYPFFDSTIYTRRRTQD